jgi:plastocyanin
MNGLLLAWIVAAGVGQTPSAAATTIHIKNFSYVPATLTVAPGATIRFVNDDAEAHTVTAVDRTFDSSGLDAGDSWTHRFIATGKFAYFCALHPYMHGVVIVRASNAPAAVSERSVQ